MLQLSEVVSGYGSTMVLDKVTLDLQPGSVEVVLGRNGVGKTTLLKTIIGELPVRSGRITFDGTEMSGLQSYRRAIMGLAYVPQGREIFPALSVLDNLRIAVPRSQQRRWSELVEGIMTDFPALESKARAMGRSLSGGQQQILALGRALISEPKVLLLDEPSEGIQPSIVADIAHTIRRVAAERGIAVLVAEQNLDFVRRLTESVRIFDHGSFVRELSVAELSSNVDLQHEYLGV